MKTAIELNSLKLNELREYAKEIGIESISKYKKDELIDIIKDKQNEKKSESTSNQENFAVEGILEVLEDGYGFLRSDNYLSGPDDVFVSPTFIRKFNLKTGDWILGKSRM